MNEIPSNSNRWAFFKKTENTQNAKQQKKKWKPTIRIWDWFTFRIKNIWLGFVQFTKGFGIFTKFLINSLVCAAIILLVIYTIKEFKTNSILIEPFLVPPELEKEGYSGRVVTYKLIDQINKISTDTRSFTPTIDREFIPSWETMGLEIEVPAVGISLKTLTQYLKRLLLPDQTHITGEITINQNQLLITTRLTGRSGEIYHGNLDNLEEVLLQTAEHVIKHTEPIFLAAYYYQLGEEEACLEMIEYVLANSPTDDDKHAYHLWGIVFHLKDDFVNANTKYQKAIELDPKYAIFYNNLGFVLSKQGKGDEAITQFQKAIELDPKEAIFYNNLGLALSIPGIPGTGDEAITQFQKAIGLDPKEAIFYSNLGLALSRQGKGGKAITQFQKAIELDSKNDFVYNNWGISLHEQEKYDEAITQFQKAIELNSQYIMAYFNLGIALKQQRKYNEAKTTFNKVIQLDPNGHLGESAAQHIQRIEEMKLEKGQSD